MTTGKSGKRPYHHGNLAESLLDGDELILALSAKEGMKGIHEVQHFNVHETIY